MAEFKSFISLLPLPFPMVVASPTSTNPMFGPYSAAKATEIFWRMNSFSAEAYLYFRAWQNISGSSVEIANEDSSWSVSIDENESLAALSPHMRLKYKDSMSLAFARDPNTAASWAGISGPYFARSYSSDTKLEDMQFYFQPDIMFVLSCGLSISSSRPPEDSFDYKVIEEKEISFFGSSIKLAVTIPRTYAYAEEVSYVHEAKCTINVGSY